MPAAEDASADHHNPHELLVERGVNESHDLASIMISVFQFPGGMRAIPLALVTREGVKSHVLAHLSQTFVGRALSQIRVPRYLSTSLDEGRLQNSWSTGSSNEPHDFPGTGSNCPQPSYEFQCRARTRGCQGALNAVRRTVRFCDAPPPS